MKPFLVPRHPALLAAAALFLLPACGDDGGGGTPNLPPTVTITGGPPEGGEDSYLAEISWMGSDPDGTIDLYEVAVDPPRAFSLDEIGDPEGSGLTRAESPGSDPDLLVLTYSKTVDGETVSFDYEQTRETSRTFVFETPDPDSTDEGGMTEPLPRFSGLHTVYVRSRDDREAVSFPARLSYTAVTATPTSHLIKPIPTGKTLFLPTDGGFCWSGWDTDSPGGDRRPVAYVYKLVALSDLHPPVDLIHPDIEEILFEHPEASVLPWIRQEADSLCTRFQMQAPEVYVFAVRAVDVAGAVEPFVDLMRGDEPGNALVFQTLGGDVYPTLNVTERLIGDVDGELLGVRDSARTEFEVPLRDSTPFEFTWTASAESYGGTIDAFRWRLDEHDSGWIRSAGTGPVTISLPGLHVLTIQVRDTDRQVTTLTVLLRVGRLPFDREALVVDDFRDTIWPRDSEHDDFWLKMLTDSGRFDPVTDLAPEVWKYDVHGANDVLYTFPIPPDLSLLGRYKMVLWSTLGSGYSGISGLSESMGSGGALASYVSAGGSLWISGELTVAAMLPTYSGLADLRYPLTVTSGSFPWKWLKMYSDEVGNDRSEDRWNNGLIEVDPHPGRPEIWPALVRDDAKERDSLRGMGLGNCDAIFGPIRTGREPGFRGILDSLYVYGAHGPRRLDQESVYEGKLNGFRYHDPDPEPRQGPIVWFGFPMYYWYDDHAQAVVNGVIDWFREVHP